MNPSVKDRLGSVVRALSGVVLPALPKDASLAQEQVMLAMGHIQIILAQMDGEPAFLAEEEADLVALGNMVAGAAQGGAKTAAAKDNLGKALQPAHDGAQGLRTAAVQDAIDGVLLALAEDGNPHARAAVRSAILKQGAARADKDRRWFAAMGFDIDYSGG